jgi:hypothetical protein
MRARTPVIFLAVLVLGVGLFFAGRASVSNPPSSPSNPSLSTVVSASFSPLSVDFTTVTTGWALGTTPCHNDSVCLSLSKTTDAGRTWTVSPLPQSLLHLADRKIDGTPAIQNDSPFDSGQLSMNVRFANANDGWIYGSLDIPPKVSDEPTGAFEPILWSTHDGGRVWKSQSQPWIYYEGTVLDLESNSNTVYYMALNKSFKVTVESSPVSQDRWHVSDSKGLYTPAGGGFLSGAIVFSGDRGWLVEGNDRGVSGSAQLSKNGKWVQWTPPCYSVGNSLAVPAAATSNHLFAECRMGGYASPLSNTVPRGATLGSTWLYKSVNAGRTFTAVTELGPQSQYFGPEIAASSSGTILITESSSTPQSQNLLGSFDAGRHWSVVYSGYMVFMHFIDSNEGDALVERSHGPNRLIMTFDGGHNWLPIPF